MATLAQTPDTIFLDNFSGDGQLSGRAPEVTFEPGAHWGDMYGNAGWVYGETVGGFLVGDAFGDAGADANASADTGAATRFVEFEVHILLPQPLPMEVYNVDFARFIAGTSYIINGPTPKRIRVKVGTCSAQFWAGGGGSSHGQDYVEPGVYVEIAELGAGGDSATGMYANIAHTGGASLHLRALVDRQLGELRAFVDDVELPYVAPLVLQTGYAGPDGEHWKYRYAQCSTGYGTTTDAIRIREFSDGTPPAAPVFWYERIRSREVP